MSAENAQVQENAPTFPSLDELVDALEAPGLLLEQPAVQRLLALRAHENVAPPRRQLRALQGGREDPELADQDQLPAAVLER